MGEPSFLVNVDIRRLIHLTGAPVAMRALPVVSAEPSEIEL
jgi:hypothetical protein